MDIQSIILTAKIGGERKAAQEDTCGPFAAALYDVLMEQGIVASIKTAAFIVLPGSQASWYHAVVEVDGRYYEPLRVCRRLQLLRRWSHDEQDDKQVFA